MVSLFCHVPMRASLIGLVCSSALLAACDGGGSDGSGRSAVALKGAETTIDANGVTTIRQAQVAYDGARLKQIDFSINGSDGGRMQTTYSGDLLSEVAIIDPDGDHADLSFSYDPNARLIATQFAASQAFTMSQQYTYDDDHHGLPQEVVSKTTLASGSTTTAYRRFEHDDGGRLQKITDIDGATTTMTEIAYDDQSRVQRATTYSGSRVAADYTYAYDPKGRIQSVTTPSNQRWDVTYDGSGVIDQIREIDPTSATTTTTKYTYASGDVSGAVFTPALPNPTLFDLRGKTFPTVDFLAFTPSALSTSVPGPNDSGGGGPVTCDGYTAQTACDTCAFTNCCDSYTACVNSSDCTNYYNCAKTCTDQTCVNSCASYYPSGASLYQGYNSCASSHCASQCAS
jgi:YD repeat-containing protein